MYPALTPSQALQLARVDRSNNGGIEYAPCQVSLTSGDVIDRVYVVEASVYMSHWGVDPRDDPGKQALAIEDVVGIESSPTRLPARMADEVYAAGESGMGYVIFTVVTRDGSQLPYVTGNAVDFPMWPHGIDPEDVVRVLPHVGRENFTARRPRRTERSADYFWCLYSG
jgi:hypothetical protein